MLLLRMIQRMDIRSNQGRAAYQTLVATHPWIDGVSSDHIDLQDNLQILLLPVLGKLSGKLIPRCRVGEKLSCGLRAELVQSAECNHNSLPLRIKDAGNQGKVIVFISGIGFRT